MTASSDGATALALTGVQSPVQRSFCLKKQCSAFFRQPANGLYLEKTSRALTVQGL